MRRFTGALGVTLVVVERVWREQRCLSEPTISSYRCYVKGFLRYCQRHGLQARAQLTHAGTTRFARQCIRGQGVARAERITIARTALKRTAEALQVLGERVPPWVPQRRRGRRHAALLRQYAEHLRRYRGVVPKTITLHLQHLHHLLEFLRRRHRSIRQLRLTDIDALIVERRKRCSVRSAIDLCHVLRIFLRILHASGRLKVDLSPSVRAPVRRNASPPRALPWRDVQRMLRGIERTTPLGRRDFALLLMMSAYGCVAGEVIGLQLQDIDWQVQMLRLMRAKSRSEILMPLFPAVALALADYLRHARPARASTRAVFVRAMPPYVALSSSSAVRHTVHRHARRAGVTAAFLGSHVLRHTHACRQMQLGTRMKLIGDILGHRAPESTSAYLRVSIGQLRRLALPVPR
jgi:site-specific recombinase XerD